MNVGDTLQVTLLFFHVLIEDIEYHLTRLNDTDIVYSVELIREYA